MCSLDADFFSKFELGRIFESMKDSSVEEIEVAESSRYLRVKFPSQEVECDFSSVEDASDCINVECGSDCLIKSTYIGIFKRTAGLTDGSLIDEGQIVGHVESIGIPYEIKAGVPGKISVFHVKNGEIVDYGTPIISISTES